MAATISSAETPEFAVAAGISTDVDTASCSLEIFPPNLLCRWARISPRVRISDNSSPKISGNPGILACTEPRISTRLIESIPRSDSMSIPSSSISVG